MNATTHSIRSISSSVILLLAISAHAATVWDGPMISFTKSNYANPLLATNQDRLTTNVWITRGSAQGLFNAKTESGFTHYVSPAGTEWANGSLENYATLSYTDWNHWAKGVNPNPYATVGVQAVLHLIPDDIYLSVRFTSWTGGAPGGGPSYGGGFSYLRSTPVPEPTNAVPIVTWQQPANNAAFPPGFAISLQARATDSDGTVSNVDFFATPTNGPTINVGQGTLASGGYYVREWTNPPPGQYQLHAEAVDNAGGRGISDLVQIVVTAILAGPITNAANAHIYYLLSTNTWTASEAEARGLGGHLVTINDAAENQWVMNTFFPWTGDAALWIGLNDAANEGQFVWASGEPVTFTYWHPGQPNNLGGEDYAAIRRPGDVPPTGSWNDTSGLQNPTAPTFGVVELPPDPTRLPAAATQPADQILPGRARLNGQAKPSGSPTLAWFEWGTSLAYGNATPPQSVGSGNNVVGFSNVLVGLVSGTQYHFRALASNAFGFATGADQTFNLGQRPSTIHTNTITGASFVPRNMTIKAGDTIVWVNVAFHSVTGSSAQEPFCGSTIFGASDVWCSATFNVPGTYNYYCRPHNLEFNMNGSVTVQPVFEITDIRPSFRTNLIVSWDGSPGPYALQKKEDLGETGWRDLVIDSAKTATVRNEVNQGFFRIEDIATLTNVPFSAYLSGAMERPVVTTAGTGFGTFRLVGNTLHFDIRYENLSSVANAAHIHGPAPASLGAGVLVNLGSFNGGAWGASGTLSGSVDLTPAIRNAVLAGKTYVNIHTVNNGDGEIRGQIAPVLMQAAISGPAERPPRPSLGQGQGTFFLVGTNLTFNITYRGLLSAANNAHIHGPADTADSASVMRDLVAFHDGPLAAVGSFGGTMGLTPQQLANVLDGLTYVNIHTTNFPQGEVRGQITPKASAIPLSASLTGAAEKPDPVTTPGTGIASFRIEGNNLHFEVRYKDLTSVATDAHIHGPANSTNNAAPIIFLASHSIGPLGTGGALAGTVPLTAQQKTMLLNGQTYINIHTANNTGGEIRGQIGTVLMTSRLDGAQAGVTTSGIGSSSLLVVGNRLAFEMTYRNLTGTANDAHIHGPAPVGQGAGILFELVPFHNGAFGTSGSFTGTGTLSPSVLGYVIDGLTYINIHSSSAGGGEIRGQVTR